MRYIQWFVCLPLLLLELLLATGLSTSDVALAGFSAVVLVINGLVGALVPSDYKWGYYVFGVAALFYIWYVPLSNEFTQLVADLYPGTSFCGMVLTRPSPLEASSARDTSSQQATCLCSSSSTPLHGHVLRAATSSRSPPR